MVRPLAFVLLASCGSGDTNVQDASSDGPATGDASSDAVSDQSAGDGAMVTGTTLATNVGYPYCLASDATNVYYCSGSDVFVVPIAGGTPTNLATNPNQANTWSIAVGTNLLYVLDPSAGYIGKVPVPAGGWTWLENSTVFTPGRGLVLAGTKLYWLAQLSGKVMQVDISGGTPTALAQNQISPAEIAGDSSNLYWVNQDSQNGAVVGVALPSGTAAPLTAAGTPRHIAMDATNVYYVATGADAFLSVFMVPRTGGPAKEILNRATGLALGSAPLALAAIGGAVYVSANYPDQIFKVGSSSATVVVKDSASIPALIADTNNLYWISGDGVSATVVKKAPRP